MRALVSAPAIALVLAMFCGCAATPEQSRDERDPWEAYNRGMAHFNDQIDSAFLKPVSIAYAETTPGFVQRGVYNFFDNLTEASNAVNHVLQGKWADAVNSTGRLMLNSTLGLGGVVDVASRAGLSRAEPETFGQTLSTWGVGAGPYLVLPLFGPSTVTDALGKPVDWQSDPSIFLVSTEVRLPLRALDIVDTRARLLPAEQLITGDRYAFLRQAYLQRREYLVNDGAVEDDFGGDFDGGDFGDEGFDFEAEPSDATESPAPGSADPDDFGFDF